jgi:hypothetical protein
MSDCCCFKCHYSEGCNCTACREYRLDPINRDIYKRRTYHPSEYNPNRRKRDTPYEEQMRESQAVYDSGVLDPY